MGINFKEVAKNVAGGSFISAGRQKVKLEDLSNANGGRLTVKMADLWNGENGRYCACVAAEDESVYFTGGKALTEIVEKWVDLAGGDCEVMSKELADQGGVLMEFERTKTKSGRDFTQVTIVDTTGE